MPKRLPKGLLEFGGSLDREYGPRILPRLLDLPGADQSNLKEQIERYVSEYIRRVDEAEKALSDARQTARRFAEKLFRHCLTYWTIKELQEATGYD
jgi:hypothetical protein